MVSLLLNLVWYGYELGFSHDAYIRRRVQPGVGLEWGLNDSRKEGARPAYPPRLIHSNPTPGRTLPANVCYTA